VDLREKNRKFALAVQEDRRRQQATIEQLRKDNEDLTEQAKKASAAKVGRFFVLPRPFRQSSFGPDQSLIPPRSAICSLFSANIFFIIYGGVFCKLT